MILTDREKERTDDQHKKKYLYTGNELYFLHFLCLTTLMQMLPVRFCINSLLLPEFSCHETN